MAIFSSGSKIAFGFGLGVVAAGVVKEILPAFEGLGRPLLKATVKAGLILNRDGRFRLDEFRETLADVRAEAEAELNQSTQPEVSPAQPFAKTTKHSAGVM